MEQKQVKQKLNRLVAYRGEKYIMTACILRRADKDTMHRKAGEYFYSAELLDERTKRCSIVARLEDVEEI